MIEDPLIGGDSEPAGPLECPACDGDGLVTCPECNGTGKTPEGLELIEGARGMYRRVRDQG